MQKILTVYYSRKGENYWGGTVKPGLAIRGCKAEQSEAQVAVWAKQSI